MCVGIVLLVVMIVKFTIFIAIIFAINIHNGESLEVLGIFPTANRPEYDFENAIMHSLVDAGHKVTVISAFPDPNPPGNYTLMKVDKKTTAQSTVLFKVNQIWGKFANNGVTAF